MLKVRKDGQDMKSSEILHHGARDNNLASNVRAMTEFPDMVYALKNYALCFAGENRLTPKDIRPVDLAKELESCALLGQKSSTSYRRYARVGKTVAKQASVWDDVRELLEADDNKLGLVHLECTQLFSLDSAGFILTLEALNAYLTTALAKKKKSGGFAPGPFFHYTERLYENTRAAFNDHSAEEGVSFQDYLDIEIPQTHTLKTTIRSPLQPPRPQSWHSISA